MYQNSDSDTENIYDIIDLCLRDKERCKKINDILEQLILSDAKVQQVGETFTNEMAAALAERPSSLQMENTYIPELPDGTEEGIFLALDLGGTNFRAILLELRQGQVCREEVKRYHIADEMRLGCGKLLFDFLAECLVDFVAEHNLQDVPLPLGFTFSFPMKQHSLDSGSLVTWTKSFNCSDVVDKDVVQMLRDSLQRCGHNHIDVAAILNDTTGTLIEGARRNRNTRIGIVVGTGSNACYVEEAERVQHWETERHNEKKVIIDIEWGALGDNGSLDFIKSDFDLTLDSRSLLVNSFTFEKYIGGKYLGELVRTVLETLASKRLFLLSNSNAPSHSPLFTTPWSFGSDNISEIERDTIELNAYRTITIFKQFNLEYLVDYDDDDIQILKYVAAIISYRAAKLVSINTAILLNRMLDEENVTIAIDGSVYKHHPRLKGWLERIISKWAPTKKFNLMLAEDGSGKGAGLAAAIALRLRKRA